MINKKIMLSLLCLISSLSYGQVDSLNNIKEQNNRNQKRQSDKTQYIFNSKNTKINSIGLYFAPEMGVTKLDGNTVAISGGSFMFLINKKIGFGFSGYLTGNPNNKNEISKLGYGGVKLEYTIKPNSKFHATIPLIIGTGFANNDSLDHFRPNNANFGPHGGGRNFDQRNRFPSNHFLVIQPGLNIEGNLLKYLKIYGGVNYRIASKMNDGRNLNTTLPDLKPSQVSGLSVNIGLKIGLFDYQLHKRDSARRRFNRERSMHR